MKAIDLRRALPEDLDGLLTLVAAYHEFEEIGSSAEQRRQSVARLLGDSSLGAIWCVEKSGVLIGYIAICFGYSIEFGGRDAFVDEFFIVQGERGKGVGGQVLEGVKAQAAADGVVAMHLEVHQGNEAARRLYGNHGFTARDRFHLMSARLNADG